jgi:hypothetical protein
LTGNWGEFGSYFGAGLSASLIVRAIPALIPAAVILIPAAGLGLAVYTLTADGSAKLRSQLILIAVATALLSANWDAWLAWVIANSQLLLFTAALLIACGCFVVTKFGANYTMLTNKNQAIVSGLLGLGIAGFAGAVALPFNDQIEYRIGNRIESRPAWLVPPKAEFRAIGVGYGGYQNLACSVGNWWHGGDNVIARKRGTGANSTKD